MRNVTNKIHAGLLTLLIQISTIGVFFMGGLMDPLILVYMVGVYFLVVCTFLIYRCLVTTLPSRSR